MKRYRVPGRVAILEVAAVVLALATFSCSGIMLSEVVNRRTIGSGVLDLVVTCKGDRTVLVAWTPPPLGHVASYLVVNATTGERHSVQAGAETALAVPVPKNNVPYRFEVYALDASGIASSAKAGYCVTSRPPKVHTFGELNPEGTQVVQAWQEQYYLDQAGRIETSVIRQYDYASQVPGSVTGSTQRSYDAAGNQIALYEYSGSSRDSSIITYAKLYEYDSTNRWVKRSDYEPGDTLKFYDVASRDSSGALTGLIRYGPDGSIQFTMSYSYNADGYCTREAKGVKPDGTLYRVWEYSYDDEWKLIKQKYRRGTTLEGMVFEYDYNAVTGDIEEEREKILKVDGSEVLYYMHRYEY